MRLLICLLILSNVQAADVRAQDTKSQEPTPPRFTQLIGKMSNANLEKLSTLAENVSQLDGLGDCERIVYRVKMDLPSNVNYDAPLNEFMSRVTPGDRTYNFGILAARAASDNSILKLATEATPDETRAALEQFNSQTIELLNSDPYVFLMAGTAVYSGKNLPDNQMTIRAIVDREANEFVMLGVGRCR